MSSSQTGRKYPAQIVISPSAGDEFFSDRVIIAYRGAAYKVGESFTIAGTFLGGTSPKYDLIVSVATVNSYGGILALTTKGIGAISDKSFTITLDFVKISNYVRGASEWTTMNREVKIYNESRVGNNILGDSSREILQSNQFRMSFLFGQLKSGDGFCGVFGRNGPTTDSRTALNFVEPPRTPFPCKVLFEGGTNISANDGGCVITGTMGVADVEYDGGAANVDVCS